MVALESSMLALEGDVGALGDGERLEAGRERCVGGSGAQLEGGGLRRGLALLSSRHL